MEFQKSNLFDSLVEFRFDFLQFHSLVEFQLFHSLVEFQFDFLQFDFLVRLMFSFLVM